MTDLAPAEQDFTIRQGDHWRAIIKLFQDTAYTVPYNATGCEADIEIREGVAESGAAIILAASTRATGDGAGKLTWLSYSSDNTVDEESEPYPGDGVLLWEHDSADTTLLAPTKKPRKGGFEDAEFVYELAITNALGERKTVMRGTITTPLEVTRRS